MPSRHNGSEEKNNLDHPHAAATTDLVSKSKYRMRCTIFAAFAPDISCESVRCRTCLATACTSLVNSNAVSFEGDVGKVVSDGAGGQVSASMVKINAVLVDGEVGEVLCDGTGSHVGPRSVYRNAVAG